MRPWWFKNLEEGNARLSEIVARLVYPEHMVRPHAVEIKGFSKSARFSAILPVIIVVGLRER